MYERCHPQYVVKNNKHELNKLTITLEKLGLEKHLMTVN